MSTSEILLESKTAREGQLIKVTHESAIDTLSKAKALVFALWQGTGAATTQEVRSGESSQTHSLEIRSQPMFDAQEYGENYKLQKLFANSQLPDVSLYKVKFASSSEITTVVDQQFFFYQGKWRNTNPDSEFGALTFDKDEIRPIVYWS